MFTCKKGNIKKTGKIRKKVWKDWRKGDEWKTNVCFTAELCNSL